MSYENFLIIIGTILQTIVLIEYDASILDILCLYIISVFISLFYLIDQLSKINFPVENENVGQILGNAFKYNTYVYIVISNIVYFQQ